MENNALTKKYGLITAICMVVGIVIGSGIFFKATKVLSNTGANMGRSLLVVGIVGAIMMITSYTFALLANKYVKVNGVVDYAEGTLGKRYAYYIGWFLSTMYYPILTATLAWVSAKYACILLGKEPSSAIHLTIAAFFLVGDYALNTLSPKLAGKLQVSTTFIKLVPIVFMGVVGTVLGLINGVTLDSFVVNISNVATENGNIVVSDSFFAAVAAFAFAYEGWIVATTINSEIKNSKKNLPIALIVGSVIVIAVYLLYFLGMTGALSTEEIIASGDNLPKVAFSRLFGSPIMGTLVMVLVVISCLGTMNGLMLACCRGMYSLAVRGQGPAPKIFAQVDKETNTPTNSSIIGLLFTGVWLVQWQYFFYDNTVLGQGNVPLFWCWEADEVSIISLYALYIPMFVAMIIKSKELNLFNRFVVPILAIACCIFMCYCAYDAYKGFNQIWSYLIVFAVVMAIGTFFYRSEDKANRVFNRQN